MKLVINGQSVNGKPEDLAKLLEIFGEYKEEPVVKTEQIQPDDLVPLEEVINDSQSLRQKLEEDPNYNPYPGVVPPKEAEVKSNIAVPGNRYAAEEDTGVSNNG